MKHQLKNTTNLISESGRAPSLRHVERSETSRDTTTEFGSQGPHALTGSGRRENCEGGRTPSLCHPEERSDMRVSGQVGTEFVSQSPHGGKAPSGRRASGEQGRSMVEMLGTLAIMGVLSIGGVAGYRYAVDKANANAILDGVNKRAVIVSQQRIVGQEVNLSEFEADIKGAYPTTAEIYADSRFFAVLVDKVPQGVCDHILREKTRFASDVFVSTGAGTGVDDCPEGDSTIEFTFANDFNAGEQLERCTTKSDCASACEDCQNGVCVESCPTGQACALKSQYPTTEMCCPTDRIMNGVCCASITEGSNGEKLCCTTTDTSKCCPAGQFYANDNKCHSCDEPNPIFVYTGYNFCAACPNRVSGGRMCAASCVESDQTLLNGQCLCPESRPIMHVDGGTDGGRCFPCGHRGLMGRFVHTGDGCNAAYWCGNMKCGGGYMTSCPSGQIGFGWYDTVSLTNGTSVYVVKDISSYGACFACDEVQIDTLKYRAQCEICGGTWSGDWNNGSCTPPTE